MPNWCLNELKIYGDPSLIEAFIEKAKGKDNGTDFSLDSFLPVPEELYKYTSPPSREEGETEEEFEARISRFKEEYGAEDWYSWCINHWGTKWDVEAKGIRNDPGEVEYFFDSAWGPPLSGLEAISRQFPGLNFEVFYYEPGMCFGGIATIRNGEVTEEYFELDEAVEWLRKNRPDIWEEFYEG